MRKGLFHCQRRYLAMRIKMKNPDMNNQPKRPGVIAMKCGMVPAFDKWGVRRALTVLQIENCQITQIKTSEKDGFDSVQVGTGLAKFHRVAKPQLMHFLKAKVPPKRHLAEFKVTPDDRLKLGLRITAKHFVPGQYVDIQGNTIGKGFQGGMKRWGFKGLPASHGVTKSHRSIGAIGSSQTPGKIWKGKKMPGRMGNQTRTVQNLRVYKIDPKNNLIFVEGQVPGKAGNMLRVKDSIKKIFSYEDQENEYYMKYIDNYSESIQETLRITLPYPTDFSPEEELEEAEPITRESESKNPLSMYN